MFWPFKRKTAEVETRAASGFTAEVIQAREAYVSGRRGIAELTATAQSCVSMWEHGLSLADVTGTRLLDRLTLAQIGRALALRGEAVFLIAGEELVPASDWDLRTRNGRPTAYRMSIPEAGGGRTLTALAAEVLHVRTGCDPAAPYYGTAPLKRAALTAGLLNAVEAGLTEVYENAPLGSQIVPLPDSAPEDMDKMRSAFRGRRGSVLVVEGVAQATAAGMNPQLGQRKEDLTPDMQKAMTADSLAAARSAISMAFGVLPAFHNVAATGPVIREAQRHLATWVLQPLAEIIAEEATAKLGTAVSLDVHRALQSFDAGGSARALAGIIGALAQAKEAGLSDAQVAAAFSALDWTEARG
jgi:phage portal protein BeeE